MSLNIRKGSYSTKESDGAESNFRFATIATILRRLRSDLLNPKFGNQKSALL